MTHIYFTVTNNISNTVCFGLSAKSPFNSGVMRAFAEDGAMEDYHNSFANLTHNSILLHAGYFPSHLFKRTISFPVFKGTSP